MVSLDKISEDNLNLASKLREAFTPSLKRQHNCNLKAADFEAEGLSDYAKVFGHRISARHWRSLFKRTVDRDAGAGCWNKLQLYLPENPKLKTAPTRKLAQEIAEQFRDIADFIAACSNPSAPNETEQRAIWTLALEKHDGLISHGTEPKKTRRMVRDFLFTCAPRLAPTRDALYMAFVRRLERWRESAGDPKALRDGRETNGARFELPDEDRDLLIQRAVFQYRGNIAPAWRECLRQGFSKAVVDRYDGAAAKKSHVPASVLDLVAPEVEILNTMHQGPRAFDAIKGHVTRNYDGIHSLQCVSGDDFTLNTYFFVPDGSGWFNLTRGQVILFIDFRSLRILGWALEPRKSYSSLTIRSLCTHIFGEFGVPEVLYFERGLWKSATLLKGKTDSFTFTEVSQGLREFGVQFIHAIRPRTKAVERVGGMFQDLAEAEPGYCGRDERRDAPESLRRQMAEVEARKTHPSKYFYSLDQWNWRIGQIVDQYNSEVQQGHILAGQSPDQAFERYVDCDNPPMQFSAGLRYLLAHDKRQSRVTLNGVTIQVGKQKFNYRGQEIAHLVGREVLAWFDPENPETIVVTNPDRTNPICISRSENPNALESLTEPESGSLGRELARIEDMASHMKTRFNVVKAKFQLPQRRLLAAAQAVELGEEIAAQRNQIADAAQRRQRNRSQAARFAQRTGIAVPERAHESLNTEDARIVSQFLNGKDTE